LDASRDWGHAKDYVEAMYLMLQQDTPEDFVIATGTTVKVREFARKAFMELGIELEFLGENENETAIVKKCHNEFQLPVGKKVIAIDKRYYRPTEVELLIGDPTKAKTKLGWNPKYSLDELIKEMVLSDLNHFKKDKYLMDGGHGIKNYYE
jgi:GDPmannose 4,6-dehydratase